MKKAVVLFSGGLDSTTCLAIAKSQGFECHALSFQYGQSNSMEVTAAQQLAAHFGVSHQVLTLPIGEFGGSALTDASIAVPEYSGSSDIPVTYVPARNTIFLSIALGYAEVIAAFDIFIGVSAIDYSHYPDCRPEFISAFENIANLATKQGVTGKRFHIHAPLIHLTKAQTVLTGLQLGVDYGMTVSCYRLDEQGAACGSCDSCDLRKKGFTEAKIADPTHYR